jgi:hypothetical protein
LGRNLFIDDDTAGREMALLNLRKAWLLGIVAAACLLASASPALPAESAGKPTVRFGVIPRFNPHVTYEYYQPLIDYLSRNSPGGSATFSQWGPELRHGFVRARGEDYDFLYRKIVSIPTGCGIRCHTSNPFFAN